MPMDLNGNNGNAQAASPAPASAASPSSSNVSGQSSASSASNSPGSAGTYSIKVNGNERQVSHQELIDLAQKGDSAEQRYQEAAKMRKDAENIERGLKNLEDFVSKRDFAKIEELFGSDFVEELVKTKSQPSRNQNSLSDEDMRLLESMKEEGFDMDQNKFAKVKQKASGTDNPMVNQLNKQIEEMKSQINQMKSGYEKSSTDRMAEQLVSKFESIASKYPDVDVITAATLIEKKQLSPNDYEEVFKYLDKDFDTKVSQRLKRKEEEISNRNQQHLSGVNSSGATIKLDGDKYKGMTYAQKIEAMRKDAENQE